MTLSFFPSLMPYVVGWPVADISKKKCQAEIFFNCLKKNSNRAVFQIETRLIVTPNIINLNIWTVITQ